MVSFSVKMSDEIVQSTLQRHFAEQDQFGQAFLFHRTNPTLRECIQVRTARWVSSVRQECLSKLILVGEASLRRGLSEFIEHYHCERNHQGKDNLLLFPRSVIRRGEKRSA